MAGPYPSPREALDAFLRATRSGYTDARNSLAFLGQHGSRGTADDPQALALHRGYMRGRSQQLAPFLGPEMTRALLTALGEGNETVAGLLEAAQGRAFDSPAGYDMDDVLANSIGIAEGLER